MLDFIIICIYPFLFQIQYNEIDFQQYSDNIDLLKRKEDLHIYPPRFKLWCFKKNTKSNTFFSRTLSLKLIEGSSVIEEICNVPFTTGQGMYINLCITTQLIYASVVAI